MKRIIISTAFFTTAIVLTSAALAETWQCDKIVGYEVNGKPQDVSTVPNGASDELLTTMEVKGKKAILDSPSFGKLTIYINGDSNTYVRGYQIRRQDDVILTFYNEQMPNGDMIKLVTGCSVK